MKKDKVYTVFDSKTREVICSLSFTDDNWILKDGYDIAVTEPDEKILESTFSFDLQRNALLVSKDVESLAQEDLRRLN